MQLIIHIGTHKTGTSSLQQFLRINEGLLAEKGIYYARRPHAKNANQLAKFIASKELREAKAFLKHNIDRANSINAHTLVISGESFYAMTKFFQQIEGKETDEYWRSVRESVELVDALLPRSMRTKVVVFFRRQDHFLESIYSQLVKNRSVTASIDEFGTFMNECLNYRRHMEIWSDIFPDCAACTYEKMPDNIIRYFPREVLKFESTGRFEAVDLRINERLSRDVIEYKRILNGKKSSAIERRLNSKVCTELSKAFSDHCRYCDYLTPDARLRLVGEMDKNNALLRARFGMEPFPALSDDSRNGVVPYAGLAFDKAAEISSYHDRIRRSTGYQLERVGLAAARFIRQRLSSFAWVVPVGRTIVGRQVGRRLVRRQPNSPPKTASNC